MSWKASGASLPGNGERGLKLLSDGRRPGVAGCIAPRQRGAWIETWLMLLVLAIQLASLPGNGERGLKLCLMVRLLSAWLRIAPQQRGAWIETSVSFQ